MTNDHEHRADLEAETARMSPEALDGVDRIKELEAAIGNALDLINADFFDEAGASLRAALGKERSDALPTL